VERGQESMSNIGFDFESFMAEYQDTGTFDVNDLVENMQENGCLDEFKNGVIKETLQVLFSECVMWVNSVPVIDTAEVNRIFGNGYIREISQDYLMHFARGIRK
jgi:hypothetical protein